MEDIAGFGLYANGIAPNDTRYDTPQATYVNHGHNISHNIIHDGGKQIVYGSGVWLYQSGGNTITQNTIAQFPRDGVGFYGVLPFWTAQPSGPVAPGAPPAQGRTYFGKYLTFDGSRNDATYSTWDILNVKDNLLAFNDISNCNRQGLDGGVIESWGAGRNNTWLHNSVHDNEGYGGLSVFFADDFSPYLSIKGNIAFENSCPTMQGSNCAMFMMKSVNLSVTDNIVADSNYSRVFEIAAYRMPASNMVVTRNILWNTTQRARLPCAAAKGAGGEPFPGADASSYYTTDACNPDAFGPGKSYQAGTLEDLLLKGDGTNAQRTRATQYGFTSTQLRQPVVSLADHNFVQDMGMLHVGSCSAWDRHSIQLAARPFASPRRRLGARARVGADTPWYRRTTLDYAVSPDSPLVREHGFEGNVDVAQIGVGDAFPFGDSASVRRTVAGSRIQAEKYTRTHNLWTAQNLGLGMVASHFNKDAPEPVPSGSWARYDAIDFGKGCPASAPHLAVRVRASSVANLGAAVRFQLGTPEKVVAGHAASAQPETAATIAAIAVPAGAPAFQLYTASPGARGTGIKGTHQVFMVFDALAAAPAQPPDDKPHRYWRIIAGPSDFNTSFYNPLWDVCQVEMRSAADGTGPNLCAAKKDGAIASSSLPGCPASNAFDGISNCTQWDGCSGCKAKLWKPAETPHDFQWIGFDFGAGDPVAVRSVRLKQFPNQYCASTPSLQYSDDATAWVTKWRIDCRKECPNNATASERLGWTASSRSHNRAPDAPDSPGTAAGALVDWFAFTCVPPSRLPRSGVLPPSPAEQLQSMITHAIQQGQRHVTIPPGDYAFNSSNFVVRGARSMTIEGRGAALWFAPGYGVKVKDSHGTSLTGLTVDYDPPCFSQGRVTAVDAAASTFDYAIEGGFLAPDPRKNPIFASWEVKVMYWHSATRLLKAQRGANPWDPSGSRSLGAGNYRVKLGNKMHGEVMPGDLVTLSPRIGATDVTQTWYASSFSVANCTAMVFDGVTLHGSGAFAFGEFGGAGGNTYRNIKVVRRPGATHLLASNVDGFHVYNPRIAPTITGSEIAFVGDDCFNVHSVISLVFRLSSATELFVIDTGNALAFSFNAVPGDTLQFYDLNTTAPLAGAQVAGVGLVSNATLLAAAEREMAGINSRCPGGCVFNCSGVQCMHFATKALWRVTLVAAAPLSIAPLSLVQAAGRATDGALLQGNHFHDAYDGVGQFRSSNSRITGNLFERAHGLGIGTARSWLEGAVGLKNIVVDNNTLVTCASNIYKQSAVENLTVFNNTIKP